MNGRLMRRDISSPERDQEKWAPVFLKNRATNKDSGAATELWCFHRK